jgi:hypothetical protein
MDGEYTKEGGMKVYLLIDYDYDNYDDVVSEEVITGSRSKDKLIEYHKECEYKKLLVNEDEVRYCEPCVYIKEVELL